MGCDMIIYMLSVYEEHGADDVHMFTKKSSCLKWMVQKLDNQQELTEKYYPEWEWTETKIKEDRKKHAEYKSEVLKNLVETLQNDNDVEEIMKRRSGQNLGKGWGGWQLHVVETE
jgi:hypothetical protein